MVATFTSSLLLHYWISSKAPSLNDIPSAAQQREDALHRLFEALMVTRDTKHRQILLDRLACSSVKDGMSRTRLVEIKAVGYCFKHNASADYRHLVNNDFRWVLRTHPAWSKRNMDFIRQISDEKAAYAYINQHLDEVLPPVKVELLDPPVIQ